MHTNRNILPNLREGETSRIYDNTVKRVFTSPFSKFGDGLNAARSGKCVGKVCALVIGKTTEINHTEIDLLKFSIGEDNVCVSEIETVDDVNSRARVFVDASKNVTSFITREENPNGVFVAIIYPNSTNGSPARVVESIAKWLIISDGSVAAAKDANIGLQVAKSLTIYPNSLSGNASFIEETDMVAAQLAILSIATVKA